MTDEHVDLIAKFMFLAVGVGLLWWGQNWPTAAAALFLGAAHAIRPRRG